MPSLFLKKHCSLAMLVALSQSLLANTHEIEQVHVTGQRPANTTQLQTKALMSMSPDLRDSLVRLPGVNSNGNGPLTSIAQYRGLFGDRVRVNIDGAPVVGAGPNAMDPPLANVFATPATTITLYRGIAPVTLGPETLGGALSVEKDESSLFNSTAKWQGQLDFQGQNQGDAQHVLGSLGYHQQDFFVQGFAARQDRDNVDNGNGQTVPNSFYEREAAGLLSGVRLGNHQLTASVQRVDTDDTGTAALAMDIIYIDSQAYRLHYLWQHNNTGTLSLRLFGNSNQHGMNNIAFRSVPNPMMARLNTVDSLSRGYQALWQQSLAMGELTLGADWQTAQHNSVITNPVANNLNIHNFNGVERTTGSVFGQFKPALEALELTLGLRYTRIAADAGDVANSMAMMNPTVMTLVNNFNNAERNLDFDFLDATLHLDGTLTNHWQWHMALGQKGRAPSYTELYVWLPLGISAGLADGRNYIGNLNLERELSRQLDLGLTYERDGLSISPRIFYQDINDFIVGSQSNNVAANMMSTMMTGQAPLQWDNADATLYGADLLLTARLNAEWHLAMTASIVRGERDDLSEPLYRIAPASLITRLTWQKNQWQSELEWQLFANQNDTSLLQNELPTAGYGLLNGRFGYQLNQSLTLSLQAMNLFDKSYQPHLAGVNRIAGVDQPRGERLFAPGRTFALNLNMAF